MRKNIECNKRTLVYGKQNENQKSQKYEELISYLLHNPSLWYETLLYIQ